MKVLQVTGYESPGRRFNGLAITPLLAEHGIHSRHLIWEKDTADPSVLTFGGRWVLRLNWGIRNVERLMSLQSVLYPHPWQMMRQPAFRQADLVHLHIIHSGYFSLAALPRVTSLKPVVWTLHDPWAMTGHCIYPMNCARWKLGCGQCPNLGTPIPLNHDTTRLLFKYKKYVYARSRFEVIVASEWMQEQVQQSPLFEGVNVHLVPFGIDIDFFSPTATPRPRDRFGIPDDALVICFRSMDSEFKGLPYIVRALEQLRTKQSVYLLTFNTKGLLTKLADKFSVIELGWVNDEAVTRDAFLASDIFLMPSIAEAFGMMAIEALACGRSVICFDGTSLPEVTAAPGVGLVVPMRDGDGLGRALQHLADSPDERRNRGERGRMIAEQRYDRRTQARRLAEVYRLVSRASKC